MKKVLKNRVDFANRVLFRLAWKSKHTSYEGHGNWFKDKDFILSNINFMNTQSDSRFDINHFLESTKEFKKNENEKK